MSILDEVVTLNEAAQLWEIDDSTLRYAIKNNRFDISEYKKSSNTWLILRSAMVRLYGELIERKPAISVLTAGYEGYDITRFIKLLTYNRVNVLVDVREIPLSRKKGFSKSALGEAVSANKIKYEHYKELGSPKPIRDKLHIDHDYQSFFKLYKQHLDEQKGTMKIISEEISENRDKRFCFLCFERDPKTCHRSVIASEVKNIFEDEVVITNI
jgi:uncharacterized protein (DUF488 family)